MEGRIRQALFIIALLILLAAASLAQSQERISLSKVMQGTTQPFVSRLPYQTLPSEAAGS